jgi:transposase
MPKGGFPRTTDAFPPPFFTNTCNEVHSMPGRRRHSDLKAAAMHMHLHLGMGVAPVAEACSVHCDTVRRWKRHLLAYGSFSARARPLPLGRTRILTPHDVAFLVNALAVTPDLYLDEMVVQLAIQRGVIVSRHTIQRELKRHGFTLKDLQKEAKERSAIKRAAYWQGIFKHGVCGEHIIFVDESHKDSRTISRRQGWARRGRRAIVNEPFVRGKRYSVLAAISTEGYEAVQIVEGAVTKEIYQDFMINKLVRSIRLGCWAI